MKKVVLSLVVMAVSVMAKADHRDDRSLVIANQLVGATRAMETETMSLSQRARANGNYDRSSKFLRVSYQAQDIARDMERYVISSLRLGDERQARQEMRRVSSDYDRLDQLVAGIRVVPFSVTDSLRNIDRLEQRLINSLSGGPGPGPGPIPGPRPSASCTVDIGGNFFLPKSNVRCTVFGRGVLGYEVAVNGYPTWSGQLDARQVSQILQTDKKKVGGHAVSYQVFLFTREGKILVFQQGSLF